MWHTIEKTVGTEWTCDVALQVPLSRSDLSVPDASASPDEEGAFKVEVSTEWPTLELGGSYKKQGRMVMVRDQEYIAREREREQEWGSHDAPNAQAVVAAAASQK
jgi:hypothetical protein